MSIDYYMVCPHQNTVLGTGRFGFSIWSQAMAASREPTDDAWGPMFRVTEEHLKKASECADEARIWASNHISKGRKVFIVSSAEDIFARGVIEDMQDEGRI